MCRLANRDKSLRKKIWHTPSSVDYGTGRAHVSHGTCKNGDKRAVDENNVVLSQRAGCAQHYAEVREDDEGGVG